MTRREKENFLKSVWAEHPSWTQDRKHISQPIPGAGERKVLPPQTRTVLFYTNMEYLDDTVGQINTENRRIDFGEKSEVFGMKVSV